MKKMIITLIALTTIGLARIAIKPKPIDIKIDGKTIGRFKNLY
ncbi:hypothetical protein SAMN04488100_10559 [Alkalibacterium putridalgicola]|uniref:Uncharacterized protein n=1 Tax=Alkalibacterium putridalgicola TaxID=426703 RepID=A0A1H7RNF0_9LACT|nr:hypothetical protein [Alkalibacterium putridalgicola]GEK88918.1 hypothetical protein APU01nite_09570 [Alkalibacterium putridalgicola]SEL61830.1 hypothetical protein SAMN04488100_10559 [Alkalibacterium putridalgicola]